MNATVEKKKIHTMLWRMIGGAVFGAAMTGLFLLILQPRMDIDDPSQMIAIIAGISYLLIGLSVGIGLVAPNAGSRFLNVEDADELREERPKLRSGAIACALIGTFLLVLALAPDGSLMTRAVAFWFAAACLVGVVIASFMSRKTDELTRQITLEASAGTLHVALVVLAAWAALAEFGYAPLLSPLGLIAGLAVLELIAILAVSAKKGLMTPR